ncbi:hypothetical protein [Puia sp.]|uniref:hypothetical protein n=1 Tax=Puia sp. TaxID=2045100 RepID=UPI002F3F6706
MIKATELRLENLVLYQGEVTSVYSIERGGLTFSRINGTEVNKNSGATLGTGEVDFLPIPLTAEWLGRMGFDTQDYEIDIIEWATEGRALDFAIDQIGVPPEKQPFIFSYDQGMGDRKVEIKYVHQLQNLYFALTGEELTVKALV